MSEMTFAQPHTPQYQSIIINMHFLSDLLFYFASSGLHEKNCAIAKIAPSSQSENLEYIIMLDFRKFRFFLIVVSLQRCFICDQGKD